MSATAFAPLAAAPRAAPRRAGRPTAGAPGPRPLRATYGPIGASIEKKIAEELSPEVLVVNDDSEKHANHKGLHDGHAGVRSNESHFSVTVVSEQFAGMTPIKRHRLVNSILQKEFDDGLHALQLSTKTPAEWDKANKK
jgi:BolA protein